MQDIKQIAFDLSVLSEEVIEVLLLDNTVEPLLFEEIARKNTHRPEVLRHLLDHPNTPEDIRKSVTQILHAHVPETTAEETTIEQRSQTLLQRIQQLKVGQRIQLAFKGGREIRTILLRDSNKEVMLAVLDNPRITDSEIELITKRKTSPDEIIRSIAKKREWLKKYSIVHALVTNPKTPTAIALKQIHNLRLKDLLLLEKHRNIPGHIRATAKKIVSQRKSSGIK